MQIKYIKVLLTLVGFPILVCAQTNHGFSFDNYSGIYGVASNPANSVDSKYRIHVNVLSYNRLGISEVGSISYFNLETQPNGFNGFEEFSTTEFNEGTETDDYAFGSSDIMLPSFIWNFDERFAIGLISRSRTIFDLNDTNPNLLRSANDGFTSGEAIGSSFSFNNNNLNNTAHSFNEFGLNASAVLVDGTYHFLKIGGTFKYYQGRGAVEFRTAQGDEGTGVFEGNYDGDGLSITNGNLISLNTLQQEQNTPENSGSGSQSFLSNVFNFNGRGSGLGGDIGLVYEWRPRETNRVGVRSNSGAVNKYKLKISASLLDIGDITYKNENDNRITRRQTIFNGTTIPRSTLDSDSDLVRSLTQNGSGTPAQGDVTFALPMTLNVNLDYIILNDNNYYINFNYVKGLTTTTDQFANTQMDLITLTPRYELRKFSAYLPISFQPQTGEITAGLGFRYQYITVGAAALSGLATDGKIRHLYFGLSIPLWKDLYR